MRHGSIQQALQWLLERGFGAGLCPAEMACDGREESLPVWVIELGYGKLLSVDYFALKLFLSGKSSSLSFHFQETTITKRIKKYVFMWS
ncbi:hypothetical protein [Chromobacterium sp. ASV23]|uniref:hypothetical protein n=1 Tax=Chromobacterium sp. ASV23 TaxID=2795110 RepID=UPI0018EA88DF|nr:hypothetical protein [Chromobacterium sp. ASV23]